MSAINDLLTAQERITKLESINEALIEALKLCRAYVNGVSHLSLGKGKYDFADYDLLEQIEQALALTSDHKIAREYKHI